LLVIAFFLIPQKEKVTKPFIATIVTPEELKETMQEKAREKPQKSKLSPGRLDNKGMGMHTREDIKQPSSPKRQIYPPSPTPAPVPSPAPTPKLTLPDDRGRKMRDKLFDKDVIARQTRTKGSAFLQESPRPGIILDGGKYGNSGWLMRIQEKLQAIWGSRRMVFASPNTIGEGYAQFTMKKNGQLVNAQILKPSGYRDLDNSVIRLLNDGNPYWPFPDSIESDEITLTLFFMAISS
jgi:outer membrane biosynthesis protein TonB